MQTNQIPHFDDSINTTGCCAKFNPVGWDAQTLHFKDKRFLRATTRSLMHIPLTMGKVFARVLGRIEASGGSDEDNTMVLSNELSPWKAEHLFAVQQDIEGEEMVNLSGDFLTKVFEGPYRKAGDWHKLMQQTISEAGATPGTIYFFYTTCPKCAKAYGQNYVVAVGEILKPAG